MKDVRGREIKVGDHVLYIRSIYDRNFEEGIVSLCKDDYIKIDYMGSGNGLSAAKTRRGTVTATTKKVVVMNAPPTDTEQLDILNQERKIFKSEIKKIQSKLTKVLEAGEALATENEELRAEVNKIHNRWSILDIRGEDE